MTLINAGGDVNQFDVRYSLKPAPQSKKRTLILKMKFYFLIRRVNLFLNFTTTD